MVQGERLGGFGGDMREPFQTACWRDISMRHVALHLALPVRHPNRYRTLSLALAGLSLPVVS